MDLGLQGRTAVVCGASSGIGLAIAERLVAEGANVAMFARRRELLEREAERLGALAVRGDVTNPADLKRLVDRTVAAFGGIDILVNNSGGPPRTPALGLADEQVESAVELLLLSAIRLTALCLPQLERSGRRADLHPLPGGDARAREHLYARGSAVARPSPTPAPVAWTSD